jgi:hypothetical protein
LLCTYGNVTSGKTNSMDTLSISCSLQLLSDF